MRFPLKLTCLAVNQRARARRMRSWKSSRMKHFPGESGIMWPREDPQEFLCMMFVSLSDVFTSFPRCPLVWAPSTSHWTTAYPFNPPPCSQPILIQSRPQKSSSFCGFPLSPLDDSFPLAQRPEPVPCLCFLPRLSLLPAVRYYPAPHLWAS